MAEKEGVTHPFNQTKRLAGKDCLHVFFSRNKDLSTGEAQATNLARAVGFNSPKVQAFFLLYKGAHITPFPLSNIWKMDKSVVTNVHKPHKIVARKGVSQVGKLTSGERGQTVTLICGMSAIGNYLPPMLIFPRVRMLDATGSVCGL